MKELYTWAGNQLEENFEFLQGKPWFAIRTHRQADVRKFLLSNYGVEGESSLIDEVFNEKWYGSDDNSSTEISEGFYFIQSSHGNNMYNEETMDPAYYFIGTKSRKRFIKDVEKIMEDFCIYFDKYELQNGSSKKSISSVILANDVVEDIVNDYKTFRSNKEIYKEMDIPWKRGYIFCGKPGNGKSLFIKALADEFNIHRKDIKIFISQGVLDLSGLKEDNYLEEMIEESEGRSMIGSISRNSTRKVTTQKPKPLRNIGGNGGWLDLWAYASKKHAQDDITIIYMEDLEKIIGKNANDFGVISLENLLNEIDGVNKDISGILFIGTTNNEKDLADSIISRPGRFDRVWVFAPPGVAEIERFFEVKKFSIMDNKTNKYAEKLFALDASMAFVETFVLTCKLEALTNEVSVKIAEKSYKLIKDHKKLANDIKDGKVGF